MTDLREKIFEFTGKANKKIILVEGVQDKSAFELLFKNKYGKKWEHFLNFFPCGGKQNVIKELKYSPDFIGIIDKDEWEEEELKKLRDKLKNLIILPRFCLENYLIVPEELWDALPQDKRDKINFNTLKNALFEDIETWKKHSAVWHAINPLYSTLWNSGFNRILINDFERINDENFIKAKLEEWYQILEPKKIFDKYKSYLTEISRCDDHSLLCTWIHGKRFWENHVSKKIEELFGQIKHEKFANEIWKTIKIPRDWEDIWKKIEAFEPRLIDQDKIKN